MLVGNSNITYARKKIYIYYLLNSTLIIIFLNEKINFNKIISNTYYNHSQESIIYYSN